MDGQILSLFIGWQLDIKDCKMKYLVYDNSTGYLTGWYDDQIHNTIPVPNIQITDEQYKLYCSEIMNNIKQIKVINGVVSIVDPVPVQITWDDIRNKRDGLLSQTDWTDTVSAQTRLGATLFSAWQKYRQALRDITLKYSSPAHVIWPTLADYGISS
jgi:hypothetical protein